MSAPVNDQIKHLQKFLNKMYTDKCTEKLGHSLQCVDSCVGINSMNELEGTMWGCVHMYVNEQDMKSEKSSFHTLSNTQVNHQIHFNIYSVRRKYAPNFSTYTWKSYERKLDIIDSMRCEFGSVQVLVLTFSHYQSISILIKFSFDVRRTCTLGNE